MKVKKWLLGLVTFAAMAVLCAVCAGADTYGDFNYSVLDDGTVTITRYSGSAKKVDIPEKIDGKSVTEIRYSAFYGCTSLTSVTIPDSVTGIGDAAFSFCASLTSITIPNSVTEIGGGAFSSCTSLTSIKIPDSVMQIGDYVFLGCTNLIEIQVETDNKFYSSDKGVLFNKNKTEIICYPAGIKDTIYLIPSSVTSIGKRAFQNCSNLINIKIPDRVSYIGSIAFADCTSLTSITIPDSVTSISGGAFGNCTSLTSIKIPDSVTSIDDYAFSGCISLTSIMIPNRVTEIGGYAFENCTCLTSITIPDSVTEVSDSAFIGCTSLTAINVAIENQYYASANGVLYNKDKTTIIYYPVGKKDKNYKIPDGVTSIGEYAFDGCTSLTSISIPNSVTEIGDSAFSGCTSLTTINVAIENQYYASANGVLYNKDKTELIRYPDGKKDKNYTIIDGVTSVGRLAFYGCTSFTSVTIPNSVTEIGSSAFRNCTSLTNITIPNSVTSVDSCAFMGCTSLTSITIPDSVTYIGAYALGYSRIISLSEIEKIEGFKIYCCAGTAGEKYAKDYGFTYELLDKPTLSKVTDVKLGGRAADALRINWAKNASADGYIVEMHQGNKWVRVAKITNNNTTTFRKAGLKAGTAYKFRVKAYKMSGKTALYGNYSATVVARTNPSVIKGAKLTGRAADALRINWTKNTTADGYIVEMYKGGKWVRAAKITKNSTTTYRASGLKASTVYKFRVRAYKMSGKTALYGNYSATVTARTNPSIVKGVKIAGKAKDALRVNWTKNTSAQGYIVEMYKGGKWVRVAKITNGNTTTFRKAGLAKNTTYKFRVKAYCMSGKTALYGNYGSVSGKTAAK